MDNFLVGIMVVENFDVSVELVVDGVVFVLLFVVFVCFVVFGYYYYYY